MNHGYKKKITKKKKSQIKNKSLMSLNETALINNKCKIYSIYKTEVKPISAGVHHFQGLFNEVLIMRYRFLTYVGIISSEKHSLV